MSCLLPATPVWRGRRARLGLRRTTTGLARPRKEVCKCEYSDVHVMYSCGRCSAIPAAAAAASGTDDEPPPVKARRRRRGGPDQAWAGWKTAAVAWSRLASYCCAK